MKGLIQGAFDLMHVGHIELLKAASNICSELLVSVSDDHVVAARKGPGRPIININDRISCIRALGVAKYVFCCGDLCGGKVIAYHKPKFYIKGTDYSWDKLSALEQASMREAGCSLLILDTPKRSTTEIIERIRSAK